MTTSGTTSTATRPSTSASPASPACGSILESEGLDDTFNTSDDFWGPDGVAGGGDDIVVTEAFTNGTGFYGFADLPTGRLPGAGRHDHPAASA